MNEAVNTDKKYFIINPLFHTLMRFNLMFLKSSNNLNYS